MTTVAEVGRGGEGGALPTPRVVEFRPQPGPQEQFLATSADIAIYGGQAGGGKTWALLLEPLRHIQHRGFGGVIFRRETPQIKTEGALWDASHEIYRWLGATPYDSALEWYFPPHQNRIRFAHMEHENDRFKWQGAEIPYIAFDELTHFTEKQFFYMLTRARSTCGIRPYVRATTNPDAESWVADLIAWWIDPDTGYAIPERSGQVRWFARVGQPRQLVWGESAAALKAAYPQYPAMRPKSITFIPARLEDNPLLMARDPDYEGNLALQDDVEYARLRLGNWKIRPTAGTVFPTARITIVGAPPADGMVVERIRYWDKAGTDAKDTTPERSWTVGVRMAKTADGFYWVEDVVRGQWAQYERDRRMRQTAMGDGFDVKIRLEQEPGSAGVDSAKDSVRNLAGFDVATERVTGPKVARAKGFSSQVQGGNVRLVQGAWNKAYLAELDAFPSAGHPDDQVDASSGAFNMLAGTPEAPPYDPHAEMLEQIPDDEIVGQF